MPFASAALPRHVELLLRALSVPEVCYGLPEQDWDLLLRAARSARLLGVLAVRVAKVTALGTLPDVVQRQLMSGSVEARFRRQKALFLLETVAPQLASSTQPPIVLKGAAYILQGLEVAEGRLPADVDVMVPRAVLDDIEQALIASGWAFEKKDPYDQHYYRAWSHELPPMRCAGQALELDLHHAILPPLGRLKPDTLSLFEAAVPVSGTPFRVLAPADQVLHAAAHLFQDSDCTGRLRDIVDFDGLVRAHSATDPGRFWDELLARARLHRLGRPLWYSLAFARAWLKLPVPARVAQSVDVLGPPRAARAAVTRLATLTLPPVDPDREHSLATLIAAKALEIRALCLRLPLRLLVYHSVMKLARTLGRGEETVRALR